MIYIYITERIIAGAAEISIHRGLKFNSGKFAPGLIKSGDVGCLAIADKQRAAAFDKKFEFGNYRIVKTGGTGQYDNVIVAKIQAQKIIRPGFFY